MTAINLSAACKKMAGLLLIVLALGGNPDAALAKAKPPVDICAAQAGDAAAVKTLPTPATIIVYNFLDVRSEQYTPKVMDKSSGDTILGRELINRIPKAAKV